MQVLLVNEVYTVKDGIVTGQNEKRASQLSMWLLTNSRTSVVQYDRNYQDAQLIAREFNGQVIGAPPKPPKKTVIV